MCCRRGFLIASLLGLTVVEANSAYKTWLSKFKNSLIVNLPVIPGSHDSGALNLGAGPTWQGEALWPYAQTQNHTIAEQLDLGIRFLDLRLHVIKDEMDLADSIVISHTYDSDLSLSDTLSQVKTFLDTNPTEFVILYVRIDTAHPLTGDTEGKKAYIQQTLLDSGITFSIHTGVDLPTLKVSQVAGQAILLTPAGTILPASPEIFIIDSTTHYEVCDIFESTTIAQAQTVMSKCFPTVPVSGTVSGMITGYALDGQLNSLPPSVGSVEMNDWFFDNFQSNPTWIKRKRYPVQVVLIDFVTETYMDYMIGYATGTSPNSLQTNESEEEVDVVGKSVSTLSPRWALLVLLSIILASLHI